MAENKTVEIAEAKGRPMLHWVGKRPLDHVTAHPAQLVERFSPLPSNGRGAGGEGGNLLFHGANKDVLAWLLAHGYRGKVNLVYIDPPFDSGADYVRQVQLRGIRVAKVEGEAHSLGEQIQYTDIWINDTYLQFMYERLSLLKELLADDGSIYLHCDSSRNHLLRCLMDEIYGSDRFRSEIVWKRSTPKGNLTRNFGSAYDTILYFTKSDDFTWNQQFIPHSPEYVEKYYSQVEKETGRRYQLTSLLSPATDRPNLTYEFHGHRRVWRYTKERMLELEKRGRVIVPQEGGMPREKRYLDEMQGTPLQDLWTDVYPVNAMAAEREYYPTQKSESLLTRIIEASSNPGDLVLDCFAGSGTTVAVAQRLGRRWVASDINRGAIQTTSKRLQAVIQEQIEAGAEPRQATLPGVETSASSSSSLRSELPMDFDRREKSTLSFSVYRVNDYDLQVQHNEAVNLAVELVGIERAKTDSFFDGTRGKNLVKIVPFNHPLTPLDLQLIQDELKARPQEDRDITVICLGKELAIDAWLEAYNKHRPVNEIDVIELRTDQKYGKFFLHQPAQAQIKVKRQDDKIVVEIEDFISPTIVERLEMDTPLFKAHILDWRAMVDVVLIDIAYDGEVFNIALSDVPERKDDLVVGRYDLPAPEGNAPGSATTVAVKIIDMLGEEVLVTEKV
jgi:DNA modification methylase